MKILIVNYSDQTGGASRAAYRLHLALKKAGINSQMLVQEKKTADDSVIQIPSKIWKYFPVFQTGLDSLPTKFYRDKTQTTFSPAIFPFSQLVKTINQIGPDIVHFHWMANGMLKIEDLSGIKAKIVWSLHDMWAFTGGCHYDEECGKYASHCENCKVLGSKKTRDLSFKVFERKKKVFSDLDLTIVGLSRWMADCAKKSFLFKEHNVVNLPNPIDISAFEPIDKQIARKILGLPLDKKIVLYGAVCATTDPRKGYRELMQAFEHLDDQDIELLVFGGQQPKDGKVLKYNTHFLGSFSDDISLKLLYSAANLFVVPSLQENLSNGIMESLACGTPVAAFDIGGNADMIEHKVNGYLASAFDSADLANGICWAIKDSNNESLCHKARKKVVENFSEEIVAKKYISLYNNLIS